jgi:hypothetical protein
MIPFKTLACRCGKAQALHLRRCRFAVEGFLNTGLAIDGQVAVCLSSEEAHQCAGRLSRPVVDEVIMQMSDESIGDFIYAARTCPEPAESRRTCGHVLKRKLGQVIHGSLRDQPALATSDETTPDSFLIQ